MSNQNMQGNPNQGGRNMPSPKPTMGNKDYNPSISNRGANASRSNHNDRHTQSREPATYFEFFDDGVTPNYGSLAVKNVFLTENFVYESLLEAGLHDPEPALVATLVRSILSITDRLQSYFLFNNMRAPDNMANSYMQTRYVVQSVIKNKYPLPVDKGSMGDWYKSVGRESQSRLKTVLGIVHGVDFDNPQRPEQNQGQEVPQSRQNVQENSHRDQPQGGDTAEYQNTGQPMSDGSNHEYQRPRNDYDGFPSSGSYPGGDAERPKYSSDSNSGNQESASALSKMVSGNVDSDDTTTETTDATDSSRGEGTTRNPDELPLYERQDVSHPPEGAEMSGDEEEQDALEFCEENNLTKENGGIDTFKNLVQFTFNVSKIREVPQDLFQDFMDHYKTIEEDELGMIFSYVSSLNS